MKEIVAKSLRRHLVISLCFVALLVGGFGAATALVEIGGAVIASGTIVVETNSKRIQHREGGIVQAIYVRDGQLVSAGELLVQLDDTISRANLAIISNRLLELQAQEARLKAERDGLSELIAPTSFHTQQSDPEFSSILEGQRTLLQARRASGEGKKSQLAEQIKQLEKQIEGLAAQRTAKAEEISLVSKELQDMSGLIEKGLIKQARITTLKREKARLRGEHGGFAAQIAQAGQAISERKIQMLQIDEEMRAEVAEQLPAVRAQIAELSERKVAALEDLNRLEIRAPRAGYVHQLIAHTIGGVVAAGEDLMLIVPKEDALLIEVQVAPMDVDQLFPGQEAVIRLPGFDQRSTPELKAKVLTVSADLIRNPNSDLVFYRARLAFDENEIDRLGDKRLIPGMPVEAFVQTGNRTIQSYLLKPLSDQISHAFREE